MLVERSVFSFFLDSYFLVHSDLVRSVCVNLCERKLWVVAAYSSNPWNIGIQICNGVIIN